MYRLTAVYDHPADPQKFVEHYRRTHAVLAAKLPKLRSFEWGMCETLDGAAPPYFLIAVLDWESKEDAVAALSSPEGVAANEDVVNFAAAGAFRMTFAEINKGV